MAAWVVSSLSVERFTAVWFPLKAKEWTTKTNMSILLLTMAVFQAALDAHYFFTWTLKGGRCSSIKKYKSFLSYYWPWINLTIYSIIPFIILITTSIAIVAKITYVTYEKKKKATSTESTSKVSSITITLLCLSFTFLLSTLPVVGYRLSVNNWIDLNWSSLDWAIDNYRWAVLAHVNWLNNSWNFCLYILLSPSFRKQFVGLFLGVRSKIPSLNSSVHPTA